MCSGRVVKIVQDVTFRIMLRLLERSKESIGLLLKSVKVFGSVVVGVQSVGGNLGCALMKSVSVIHNVDGVPLGAQGSP